MKRTSDLHIAKYQALPSPLDLCQRIARTPAQGEFIAESRDTIAQLLVGKDPRLLVIVGPCSIHDTQAGLDYARKLAALAEEVRERLYLVMRVYFEKPRTTVGWKGLIMDPHLDGSDDLCQGLERARTFLRDVIDLGLPTATELLDPITPQYIADLICWSAIGARTTESQTHRQMASGLSMPLGFKNATSGALTPALNAIQAALQPQTFLGVSPEGQASSVTTSGNPHCHLILRGGDQRTNYSSSNVAAAAESLAQRQLPTAIMIDASHGNSQKDHHRQPEVFREILRQRQAGNHALSAMLESNLVEGNQPFPQAPEQLTYGQSITDACLDWETTADLLREAAQIPQSTPA
ncbi:MAG: 3-deoxy-7-phosphoheptulonate synthase [Verrucomicrobiota bacterium]